MADFNTPLTEHSTATWITPRSVLARLGHFDLDPCAALSQPWPCADMSYTVKENGLLRGWRGRVWCNPPYGAEARPFMERMSTHSGGGLALVFMRSDSRWFQDAVLATARYLFLYRGRIRFCREDGSPGAAPNAASCLVAWQESEAGLLYGMEREGLGKVAFLKGGYHG